MGVQAQAEQRACKVPAAGDADCDSRGTDEPVLGVQAGCQDCVQHAEENRDGRPHLHIPIVDNSVLSVLETKG